MTIDTIHHEASLLLCSKLKGLGIEAVVDRPNGAEFSRVIVEDTHIMAREGVAMLLRHCKTDEQLRDVLKASMTLATFRGTNTDASMADALGLRFEWYVMWPFVIRKTLEAQGIKEPMPTNVMLDRSFNGPA